jgi:AraC-type transcriptional regulator N-terminus
VQCPTLAIVAQGTKELMLGNEAFTYAPGHCLVVSTSIGPKVGGYRREVDYQKLGLALLIASSLILAIRTAKWPPTHSDGLSTVELDKEVEHSARIAKIVLSHLTVRYPELFQMKDMPWFVATDEDVPK